MGELGVHSVSRIVSNNLGWLFRRVHQEHDFGIDGQIEVDTDTGDVTGQLLAVQIKCGRSFLAELNQWGYIYRGDAKHFNYLANYPIPVLLCVCDPESSRCFWVHFRPELARPTASGWTLTIPFASDLASSRDQLHSLVTPVRDVRAELRAYWQLNDLITESDTILYVLGKTDVDSLDIATPRVFFDRLRSSRELAFDCQGKIEISLDGYDDDPRELYEIAEVRAYVTMLDHALPELFFFARTVQPTFTLQLFALCQTTVEFVSVDSETNIKDVNVDRRGLVPFLARHWSALNELTDWLGMSEQDNKRISFAAIRCLGFDVPDHVERS